MSASGKRVEVPERTVLYLSEKLKLEIEAHGVESYPYECCGALLGTDGEAGREVRELYPLVNRRDDSPRNRFSIAPDDFRAAERAARERGLELIGWYHSHPDHPPLPSEYDREQAWPWYSYIILSVVHGAPREIRSWRLSDDRVRFEPEEIGAEFRSPAAGGSVD
ncbi:MAG TPA: M67 family metallopeptidase [Candidatus Acidoferrales bacterium]|nr:M67 family metallopeptidase [Candidatus Acidoferrales bacterium]